MTGRELIIYIMMNGLEDEPVFKDGTFVGFLSAEQVAEQMDVGLATVYTWLYQKRLPGVIIGNVAYIPADYGLEFKERSTDNGK